MRSRRIVRDPVCETGRRSRSHDSQRAGETSKFSTSDDRAPGGIERGMPRRNGRQMADRAIDMIRDRFGREAIGYGSVTLEGFRSVPDEFRELAEKNL